MRLISCARLITAFAVSIACLQSAFACSCGGGFYGKNSWENARKAADAYPAIFEGAPTKFEFRWDLLDAKEGELIAADAFSGPSPERTPQMVVTFHIARTYKGNLGSDVQVQSGLGGGDCGAVYTPGLNYLVYAGGPSLDQLSVSMCSPGGWLEGTKVATDLRYLRKARPASKDLAPIKRWSDTDYAKGEARRKKDYEERRKRYDAATGRICGTLVHDDPKDNGEGSIAFLSTIGYSPVSPPYAERKDDGSFCSQNLGPGKYYLYFVQQDDHGATALYYPGVTDAAIATPIEVAAGQTQSNIVFKITKQSAYSVRGFISADDKGAFRSSPDWDSPSVLLIRSDGDRRVWYDAKTSVRFLPETLYFKFDNVVPGRYFAFVQGPAGWMSRKVEVNVTTHSKFISIDLVRKK